MNKFVHLLFCGADGNRDWLFKFQDEGVNNYVMDMISYAGLNLMGSMLLSYYQIQNS
ncbi:MAG: hypothetical protein AAGC65_00190 [Mucilaginibacter sp.]|uniref:hypothetical protein n=1 Tax=Mucilaginibacter sp. TaxID=1882438 RepID=UPI0031A7A063